MVQYFRVVFALIASAPVWLSYAEASTTIYKDSYPGVKIKVVEVQGPNITDLGGSIPAFHNVRISANTQSPTTIKSLSFINVRNMGDGSMGSQGVSGLHLERIDSGAIEIMLAPDNSAESFQWKAVIEYRYKNRTYQEAFKVSSTRVKIEKPRFRKDDGLDALSASLGLGVSSDSINSSSGDVFGGLESELNLGGSQQGSTSVQKHDMDIALHGVEEHVDQMRAIRKHKHMLSRKNRKLLTIAKAINNDLRNVASLHQAQDEKARQRARAEAQKKEGGFQWGKLAAMTAGAAIGGLGSLDASRQLDVISSMVQDSRSGVDGVSSTRATVDRMSAELAAMREGRNGGSGSASGSLGGDDRDQKSAIFSIQCASGVSTETPPFKYYTESCRAAGEFFVQTNMCNEIDNRDAARARCEDECGSPSCDEL